MDLKEKLKFYESSLSAIQETPRPQIRGNITQWVSGSELRNAHGAFFRASRSFPFGHEHGQSKLGIIPVFNEPVYMWAGKDERLATFNPASAVYLDTETTGLAGGAGTVPFMIGIGFYTSEGFTVEQYFMRDFQEEKAMLTGFLERISEFEALVTYNGKCFDINLISSRLIMNRMQYSIQSMHHLDLLFTARRLYKRRLSDCSLGSIENEILGFKRHNDVPGFLIPGIYFHYLRTGQGDRLASVFEHNLWDILSLALFTIHAGGIFSSPGEILSDPSDWFSLGRVFESAFCQEKAAVCYESALERVQNTAIRYEIQSTLGMLYKRSERWEHAVNLWEQMIQPARFDIEPYEELAKYYEHQLRDYSRAMDWVMSALERVEILVQLHSEMEYQIDRKHLVHRLNRLKQKQHNKAGHS